MILRPAGSGWASRPLEHCAAKAAEGAGPNMWIKMGHMYRHMISVYVYVDMYIYIYVYMYIYIYVYIYIYIHTCVFVEQSEVFVHGP